MADSGVVVVGRKHSTKAETKKGAPGASKQPAQDFVRSHKAEAAVVQEIGDLIPGKDTASLESERTLADNEGWWTNDLAKQVVDGKSFVNTGNDEEQVWWHSSEPHGTQMARLICSIDPRCAVYVAKVAETRSSGVSANVVAEASILRRNSSSRY